jgi:hypothetical protein
MHPGAALFQIPSADSGSSGPTQYCSFNQRRAWNSWKGTVNLSGEKRDAESPASTNAPSSERGSDLRNLAPDGEGLLARSAAEVSSDGFGVWDMEEVRDLTMNR